jgi:N-hydroxyarylamine O-acetyltransferase
MSMLDVDVYFLRIGYRGALTPSYETLRDLHLAHLHTVPFENLDIHFGRPIVLDEDALFDKIVRRRRGGFCYELNGLFSALLRQLGFRVTRLSAGVLADGTFGPEFDHMTLLVELENRYLADVGFGESFWEPLSLDDPNEQVQRGRGFRVTHDGQLGTMLFERTTGGSDGYRFTFEPRGFAEYEAMCRFHQTSPESPFTQRRVCSKATPTGRITLRDTRLIVTEHGERREEPLSEGEWVRTLEREFGISASEFARR